MAILFLCFWYPGSFFIFIHNWLQSIITFNWKQFSTMANQQLSSHFTQNSCAMSCLRCHRYFSCHFVSTWKLVLDQMKAKAEKWVSNIKYTVQKQHKKIPYMKACSFVYLLRRGNKFLLLLTADNNHCHHSTQQNLFKCSSMNNFTLPIKQILPYSLVGSTTSFM